MSGALMVCGTASDVGKSQLVAGLCRALSRRGLCVAPFKGQNMALNSAVTFDGAEIGRAQATQAFAARIEAEAAMNPVLLKPTSDRTSQIIVRGRVWSTLDAAAYYERKAELVPIVDEALAELRARYDVVLCEGAGSPAEINLFENDLVNLGLASRARIPAILVGDIDRGGVFAHLFGTVALLSDESRSMIKGFVINKFRGDPALLGDATEQLESRTGIPTLGIVPYLRDLWLDAEDSMALDHHEVGGRSEDRNSAGPALDVVVIRFPRISNFTDLDPLLVEPAVNVRYVTHPSRLGDPDLIVLPGTKSTVADLIWLRDAGFMNGLERARQRGTTVLGICGGYQILGQRISDPNSVESDQTEVTSLGWLRTSTRFASEKVTVRRSTKCSVDGNRVTGYEIRHGRSCAELDAVPWLILDSGEELGVIDARSGVCGTSLHGLFEEDDFRRAFLQAVADRRSHPWSPGATSFAKERDAQIDRLADVCEENLVLADLMALVDQTSRSARG